MANSNLNLPPQMSSSGNIQTSAAPGANELRLDGIKRLASPPDSSPAPALARLAAAVARVGGRSPGSINLFIP
jgi:hypothetical protein